MNAKVRHSLSMLAFGSSLLAAESQPNPALLQFHDGSSLHGSLSKIETAQGVSWSHPAAKKPLVFLSTNISNIRFEKVEPPPTNFNPACRFYFRNGDEVIGNLLAFESDRANIETWFAGTLHTARENLEGVVFSAKGYRLIYEGPNGLDNWKIGRNARSWEYKDGSFIANGADLLGRDFGLTGSSSIEFDLTWSGSFSLSITLYAQAIDRFDYSSSAYLVYLGNGAISVQRVQAGAGASMLGQAQIPDMLRKNKMRFEIRSNKEDATIALFADGKLVQRWKDNLGFAPKGSGIVFFSQVEPRALKLSNIRVAEWESRFDPDIATNTPATNDVIFLANKDRVAGDFVKVVDDKVSMKTRAGSIDIPMNRVTQIRFAPPQAFESSPHPWLVRAAFPGGESIGFQLDEWTSTQVTGQSPIFGRLSFKPGMIRQLVFGKDRPESVPGKPKQEDTFPEFE